MPNFDFKFQDVIEEANDVVVITKAFPFSAPGPEIVYVNQAFTELTGYSFDEAVGGNPRMLQMRDTDPETRRIIREALIKQEPVRVTIRNYNKLGIGYWIEMSILPLRDDNGEVTHFAAIERDVTESKEREIELSEMSLRDPLSGLLNRRGFDQKMEMALSHFYETGETFSVLAMDIDHFKAVNDQHGHHSGDAVIQRVAELSKKAFHASGCVGRTGGEEFTIILGGKTQEEAKPMAEYLRMMIERSVIATDKGSIKVTMSLGVSQVDPTDKESSEVLIRADTALYKAKHSGRNQVCLYQPDSEVPVLRLPGTVA